MYNHTKIEKDISLYWERNKVYHFNEKSNKPKSYILDMFPYPSGSGLHVGHPKGYTATDIYARYKKFNGFNVLHPIGWDAFGLPAEQYAIANNANPVEFTQKNINVFRQQLKSLGFSFDYDKEVDTTDPKYYKWTQWIFTKLFDHGLAEIKDIDVNWCEKLKTVLSNEEVLIKNGVMVSERGSYVVTKKPMRQWVLKITKYADKLLKGLDELDWPEHLKQIQRSWIGRSEGTNITFTVNETKLNIFTTRPDTIYGVTFIAIAPENKLVPLLTNDRYKSDVKKYVDNSKKKTILQRQESKEKTGVFTGCFAKNPINNDSVPIFVCDYVLNDYANGMVMGVPSADKRDYEFAITKNIKIIPVIEGKEKCITTDGKHINSPLVNNLNIKQACKVINDWLITNKCGGPATYYKLKDWVFSRQRYWGEPFPIVFDKNHKPHIITKLPVELPYVKNIIPTDNGLSPLANLKKWMVVSINGEEYCRDSNTMPQWAGSCWYYLAYLLKQTDGSYIDLDSDKAYKLFKKWLPVDLYVGGQEHAVLHLLYARFWHRFLYDIGVVPTKEPFQKIVNQGMILGPNGEKMSKSRGNVINPNDIVNDYGADTLRLYEVFMGPVTATLPWSETGLIGCRKWLDRVYSFLTNKNIQWVEPSHADKTLIVAYHSFIKDVTSAIDSFRFNVAISKMMIYTNVCQKHKQLVKLHITNFLIVLSCFAPFIAEYLYQVLFKPKQSIVCCNWPKYDDKYLVSKTITLPIQINGKLRDTIKIDTSFSQKQVLNSALSSQKISQILQNKKPKKVIYIKNKILNIII